MPSSSKKQHNFMEAVANNPKFAKKAGVAQSVGKDFEKADKGMKFRSGGRVKRYEAGGSTYGGGAEGYVETPTSRSYSAEEIKQGIKRFGRLFGFGKEEQDPAPIETRKGSQKTDAAKTDLGSARQKLGDNDPSGIVKLPESSGTSSGTSSGPSSISSSTSGPSVAQQMRDREKGGPNERQNYAQGLGAKPEYESYFYGPDYMQAKDVDKAREMSFTSPGNAKKAAKYRQSLIGSASGSSSSASRRNTSGPAAYTSTESNQDAARESGRSRAASGSSSNASSSTAPVKATKPAAAKPEPNKDEDTSTSRLGTRAQREAKEQKEREERTRKNREAVSGYASNLVNNLSELKDMYPGFGKKVSPEKAKENIRKAAYMVGLGDTLYKAKGGRISEKENKPQKFAKGGFVKKSADGCAQRGKTRGQIR